MRPPLVAAGIALLLLLAAVGAYLEAYAAVARASSTAASLEAAISEKSSAVSRARAAENTLGDLAGQESVVEGYFVANEAVVPFLEKLQETGSALGAQVTVLSVSATKAGGQPALTVTLHVTGTFDQVVRTVGAIEYASYDLVENTLTLARNEQVWAADLSLTTGSLAPPTP